MSGLDRRPAASVPSAGVPSAGSPDEQARPLSGILTSDAGRGEPAPPGPLPPAGSHGGDGPALAHALGVDPAEIVDLSQSLNPFAVDPAPIVARHLDQLGRYPDDTAATAALAEAMSVPRDRLLLTNGGAEAIALVAAHLGRGRVDEPDFSLYTRHLGSSDPHGPRWRSNPHNPTGRLAVPEETAAVWDEAFYPLCTGRWTRGDAEGGAFVLGSLTKLLACPGLRIGYVLGPDAEVIDELRRRRPAWSVNGLAAGALPELLDTVDLGGWSNAVADARRRLVAVLADHGLVARPSDANWVLVDVAATVGTAAELRLRLAHHGVAIRDCASFGMPDLARVAVPDEAALARLDRALDQALDPTPDPDQHGPRV